ncbi:cytochrome P450 94A1-like [Nicotiana tomentosiformis]|uniref:cytochrome P450 94A1-like n=1 Tax=Nicotiana tomentosiformis TaxID=4098 RepID=UPI00388C723A
MRSVVLILNFYTFHADLGAEMRLMTEAGSEDVCASRMLTFDVVREYVKKRIAGKVEKFSMQNSSIDEGGDFFDRFITRALKYNVVVDEKFVIDTGINFILAGDDTLFSALIWFFWLVSSHPQVEKEIVKEIEEKDDDDLNEMVYTHASICESMRLYPPVPLELKQVTEDDVWPDGTKLKKGMTIFLHVLAMGRSTELWGSDCEVFRPERWLLKNSTTGNWNFIPRNPFTYPIFQAGPRTCLGKEIAFMQINLVAATILKRFQIVPLDGFSPIYNSSLTSKMKTGFPSVGYLIDLSKSMLNYNISHVDVVLSFQHNFQQMPWRFAISIQHVDNQK